VGREHIEKSLIEGLYDDRPDTKARFSEILSKPIPDDVPEEVDTTGACPVFGHFCPGGSDVVEACGVAQEWLLDR
jgi:hypothetical protein